jgi:hypothetical protein
VETISFTFFDHERLHTCTPPRQSRVARPCGSGRDRAMDDRPRPPEQGTRLRRGATELRQQPGRLLPALPLRHLRGPTGSTATAGAEIALFGSLRRANGNSCPPIRPGTHARAAPPLNRKARIAVGREHAGSHLRPGVDVVERLVRQHVVEADAPVGCAASAREDPVLVR